MQVTYQLQVGLKYSEDLNNQQLNNKLFEVRYSDHPLFRCLLPITYHASPLFRSPFEQQTKIVRYSDHHQINRPFNNWTTSDHSNTRLVQYSDPRCNRMFSIHYWVPVIEIVSEQMSFIQIHFKGRIQILAFFCIQLAQNCQIMESLMILMAFLYRTKSLVFTWHLKWHPTHWNTSLDIGKPSITRCYQVFRLF